jgi:hypothetical protein
MFHVVAKASQCASSFMFCVWLLLPGEWLPAAVHAVHCPRVLFVLQAMLCSDQGGKERLGCAEQLPYKLSTMHYAEVLCSFCAAGDEELAAAVSNVNQLEQQLVKNPGEQ